MCFADAEQGTHSTTAALARQNTAVELQQKPRYRQLQCSEYCEVKNNNYIYFSSHKTQRKYVNTYGQKYNTETQ